MLITTTQEMHTLCGVNLNMDFASLAPFIEQAEREYIIPVLGIQQYGILNNGAPQIIDQNLHAQVKIPLAWYAKYIAIPHLLARISDLGVQEVSSKEGTSVPVRQWSSRDVRVSCLHSADTALEQLMDWMERNAINLPTWTNSTNYTINRELFLSRATDIQAYFDIGGSRRAYMKLKPYILRAEDEVVRPLLGDAFFAHLKGLLIAGGATPVEEDIIKRVRKVCTYATLQIAAPFVQFKLSQMGLTLSTGQEGLDSTDQPSTQAYYLLLKGIKDDADKLKNELKQWLDTTLPHPLYVASTSEVDYNIHDNTGRNSFMA
jgi:hypothetical protein